MSDKEKAVVKKLGLAQAAFYGLIFSVTVGLNNISQDHALVAVANTRINIVAARISARWSSSFCSSCGSHKSGSSWTRVGDFQAVSNTCVPRSQRPRCRSNHV